MEPGLHSTWPRSTSSFSTPRSRIPTLSPALPLSRVLLNISTPVTVVLRVVGAQADDLDFVADLDHAALDTAGDDGAAALDREDVLDGHQEGLVDLALRLGDVGVEGVHEVLDALALLGVARGSAARGTAAPRMIGVSSPGKSYLLSSSRTSSSTSSSSSGSSTRSHLVEEDHDARARRPGGPAGRARGSGASGRPPRRPPGSRRPSGRRR